MTRLPCSDSRSSRSTINVTTMAVLLMDRAQDRASAACQVMSQTRGANRDNATVANVATVMVTATCKSPRPNTC